MKPLAVLLLALAQPAPSNSGAQTPVPAEAAVGAAPASVETQDSAAFRIGKLLRCPVCQGMPIAESPSTMAQDMMKRIRELLAEGKSQDEIIEYFIQRYGEWVLLRPKAQGFNITVWVLPPLGLLLGLWGVARALRRLKGTDAPGAPAANAGPAHADTDDPYLKAVRDEVQR